MITTVLFDLDGTLVDSAPDLAAALNAQLEIRQKPPVPYSLLRPHASSGARGMIKAGFGLEPDAPEYPALRTEFLGIYERQLLVHTQLFVGVQDLLCGIVNMGRRWGIVTNKAEYLAKPLLEPLNLHTTLGCLVCGDTTPFIKPHPAPLLEAARRMEVDPSECVYVGDDARDISAARAAGMRSIAASYGYLGTHSQPDQWGADALLSEPLELLKLLSDGQY